MLKKCGSNLTPAPHAVEEPGNPMQDRVHSFIAWAQPPNLNLSKIN